MEILNKCPFDPAFQANRQVFDYIKDLDANPEISHTLIRCLRQCGDVQIFCPDMGACRYLTISTQAIVFGFTVERDIIAYRLNKRMKEIALQTGARALPQCGEDWVNVWPSQSDWPRVDFDFWALKAYLNVRETADWPD
ncbi:MAG: hypothetical protein JF609_10990 [Verrucomicrobia bacterium]|nr:hypothetical protein [Verrucomicrobiota bacterium]